MVVGEVVIGAPPETLMSMPLTDCFFPLLLNVPVTLHSLLVTKETRTPFVHLDFFGVQLGTTLVTALQSLLKETLMMH